MRNADISCALRMASWRRELRYAAVSSGDSRRIGRVRDTRSIALLRIASVHPGKNTAECLRHGTLDVVNAFASMSEWLRAGSNAKQDGRLETAHPKSKRSFIADSCARFSVMSK